MEFVFEFLLQLLGELALQALFELLAELGLRSLADTLGRPRNAWLSSIGFLLWGILAGGISLLIFSRSAIHNPQLRLANLVVTPVLVGTGMMLLGRLRERKGQELVRLDRFGYAFLFALSMAAVRYIWAD